jgi:hypothetical protein
MEIEVVKHTDRTYWVQMPMGQERIGCHVVVDVTGSQKAHIDERRKKAAVSRAKKLAHELIDAIEALERA